MDRVPGWVALVALVALVAIVAGAAAFAAGEDRRELPAGFAYLPEIGEANVFERFADGARRGVHSITAAEAGIIRKPIDLPLTDETEIEFDWRYVTLPAQGPETSAATHDYHSIAVEFDNGQDLTWFWSRELAPDTKFRCPLPNWDTRETHFVLQSGETGLGEWTTHTRPVLADYVAAVGGEKPARIVAVWFIANSFFGKQPGEAFFANVKLRDASRTVDVFAD
jgi:hypothetical protein